MVRVRRFTRAKRPQKFLAATIKSSFASEAANAVKAAKAKKTEKAKVDDKSAPAIPTAPLKSSDTELARSVFVRNIPLTATPADIETLSAPFGTVERVFFVKNKQTQLFTGNAFVRFSAVEGVDNMVNACEEQRGLPCLGLLVTALRALREEEAATKTASAVREQNKTEKEESDPRNLKLIYVGYPSLGSVAYERLPPRVKSMLSERLAAKRLKLKQINYHVSLTRLAIRGLPFGMEEKDLKHYLYAAAYAARSEEDGDANDAGARKSRKQSKKDTAAGAAPRGRMDKKQLEAWRARAAADARASGEGEGDVPHDKTKPWLRQCRIERDPQGRSKGFGFAEFVEHRDAVAVAKAMSVRRDAFGDGSGFVQVELAIDDVRKLNILKEKLAKWQEKTAARQAEIAADKERAAAGADADGTDGAAGAAGGADGADGRRDRRGGRGGDDDLHAADRTANPRYPDKFNRNRQFVRERAERIGDQPQQQQQRGGGDRDRARSRDGRGEARGGDRGGPQRRPRSADTDSRPRAPPARRQRD